MKLKEILEKIVGNEFVLVFSISLFTTSLGFPAIVSSLLITLFYFTLVTLQIITHDNPPLAESPAPIPGEKKTEPQNTISPIVQHLEIPAKELSPPSSPPTPPLAQPKSRKDRAVSEGSHTAFGQSTKKEPASPRSGLLAQTRTRINSESDTKSSSKARALSHRKNDEVHHPPQAVASTPVKPVVPPPQLLPLRLSDCTNSPPVVIQINSREPVEFENEFFKGRLLLKVRTNPLDPVYAPYFEGRRRTFEFQLQGQFKQQPQGDFMFGGEVPNSLQMSFMTRGLSRLLLQVLKKLSKGLHYSFGDFSDSAMNAPVTVEQPNGKGELPHVTFHLAQAIDRLVVTPPGKTPPPLGVEMFPETKDKELLAAKGATFPVDGSVVSLSFHTMYVDWVTWKTVNLPGIKDVDLHSFWNDMPLYIIGYDLLPASPNESRHLQQQKRYFFRFKLENLGDELDTLAAPPTVAQSAPVLPTLETALESEVVPCETVEIEEPKPSLPLPVKEIINGPEFPVLSRSDSEGSLWATTVKPRISCDYSGRSLYSLEIEKAVGHFQIQEIRVPCCLELASKRYLSSFVVEVTKLNGSTTSYVALWEELFGFITQKLVPESKLEIPPISSMTASTNEKKKWLQDVFTASLQNSEAKNIVTRYVIQLSKTPGKTDEVFQQTSSFRYKKRKRANIVFEAVVARARWETQWREELLLLYDDGHLRIHKFGGKDPIVKAALATTFVKFREMVAEEELPFASFRFLEIETLQRIIYLSFKGTESFEKFQSYLQQFKDASMSDVILDPREVHFFKSELTDKILLNGKRIFFPTAKKQIVSPTQIIQILLEQVITMSPDSPPQLVSSFNDNASLLKQANLDLLATKEEKLAFWINCYHCLLLHTLLVMGPPTSVGYRSFYFDHVYQIGPFCYSLSEIEHAMLRSGMHPPRLSTSIYIPRMKENDPKYASAFRDKDVRLNFVLQGGQTSSLSQIPILSPENLSQQLDAVTTVYLKEKVQVNEAKKTILIPKICKWYMSDFGSTTECVQKIVSYLHLESNIKPEAYKVSFDKFIWSFYSTFTKFNFGTVYI